MPAISDAWLRAPEIEEFPDIISNFHLPHLSLSKKLSTHHRLESLLVRLTRRGTSALSKRRETG
jgi:hypothetical protein